MYLRKTTWVFYGINLILVLITLFGLNPQVATHFQAGTAEPERFVSKYIVALAGFVLPTLFIAVSYWEKKALAEGRVVPEKGDAMYGRKWWRVGSLNGWLATIAFVHAVLIAINLHPEIVKRMLNVH